MFIICENNHEEIVHKNRECPVCICLAENDSLREDAENMRDEIDNLKEQLDKK